MKIPEEQLESTIDCLRGMISDREGLWGAYDDDDDEAYNHDNQDYEDAGSVTTVLDVLRWLRDQGSRTEMVEYDFCLDPIGKFDVEKVPDDEDAEKAFREYLTRTYSIDPKEFPSY